jgi:hypothetical protein
MCGAILPLLQYVFMVWCLVKHRNNFTFIWSNLLSYGISYALFVSCFSLYHMVFHMPCL